MAEDSRLTCLIGGYKMQKSSDKSFSGEVTVLGRSSLRDHYDCSHINEELTHKYQIKPSAIFFMNVSYHGVSVASYFTLHYKEYTES